MDAINTLEIFNRFDDHWSPKLLGTVNDMAVKAVKVLGEFVWHHHDVEDELFFVVQGSLLMRFRDQDVRVNAGEYIIVPHGVEHQPVAEGETWILLFEPQSTLNTGNVRSERTVEDLDRLVT